MTGPTSRFASCIVCTWAAVLLSCLVWTILLWRRVTCTHTHTHTYKGVSIRKHVRVAWASLRPVMTASNNEREAT